jgi:hypothetical protein
MNKQKLIVKHEPYREAIPSFQERVYPQQLLYLCSFLKRVIKEIACIKIVEI